MRMSKKYRIGIKYCGGCTSRYDRVKAVEDLRVRLRDRVEFVSHTDSDIQGILVVAGCPTACVNLTPYKGHTIWILTGEQVEGFTEELVGMEITDELD
jgi:hypothetical protein